MLKSEDYIHKLPNKGKINEIDDKLINMGLEIDKIESKRLIIRNCIKEMENKMFKLREKSVNHPQNQKIGDEIEDTENKLKEGIKAFNKLNDKMTRKEIAIVKLKQQKKEEIRIGLINYLNEVKLRHDTLLFEGYKQDESKSEKLEELEREMEDINQVLKIEFPDSS